MLSCVAPTERNRPPPPGGRACPFDLRILSAWLFAFTFSEKLSFMSFVSLPKDGQLHSLRQNFFTYQIEKVKN